MSRDKILTTLKTRYSDEEAAPIVSYQAVETAIQKAKERGMAIVGVNNTHSSNLTQAYYVEKIAQQDLIGVSEIPLPGERARHV